MKSSVSRGVTLAIGLLAILAGIVFVLRDDTSDDRRRASIVRKYCLDTNPDTKKCELERVLAIPEVFVTNPVSAKKPGEPIRLEVAYPSMVAWSAMSEPDRSTQQKLEININGIEAPNAKRLIGIALAPPKPVRNGMLHGLERYDSADQIYDLFLVRAEGAADDIFIRCITPQSLDHETGCETSSVNSWHLSLKYFHQFRLISDWQEIRQRVNDLLGTFE